MGRVNSPCKAHEAATPALSPSRRGFLAAAMTGAAITLAPMSFAAAAEGSAKTKTITGHLDPGAADFVYLPVEVPAGVNKISVSYSYSKPTVAAGLLSNACDIGVFEEKGTALAGKGSQTTWPLPGATVTACPSMFSMRSSCRSKLPAG